MGKRDDTEDVFCTRRFSAMRETWLKTAASMCNSERTIPQSAVLSHMVHNGSNEIPFPGTSEPVLLVETPDSLLRLPHIPDTS